MPGRAVKLYMSDDDLAIWDYGVALLGRDRARRELFRFIQGPFKEILKEESQSPRRKDDARTMMRELDAKREAAKKRRKVVKHETA